MRTYSTMHTRVCRYSTSGLLVVGSLMQTVFYQLFWFALIAITLVGVEKFMVKNDLLISRTNNSGSAETHAQPLNSHAGLRKSKEYVGSGLSGSGVLCCPPSRKCVHTMCYVLVYLPQINQRCHSMY